MNRMEFFAALKDLVARYPDYCMLPPNAEGDIILRPQDGVDEATRQRSEKFARAFSEIMGSGLRSSPTRNSRGSGWI